MTILNPMNMTEKHILVTGASSGIGRDTAVFLSKLGAKLTITGRDLAKLNETLKQLEGKDHRIEVFDLTAVDDIPEWMKKSVSKATPYDGLVHCAGVQQTIPLRAITYSSFQEVMDINVNAVFGLLKGFRLPRVHSKHSSAVIVSSVMGLVGQAGVSVYSASKGAIVTLVKSLALELARQDIRVNCVAPGHVQTEMSQSFRKKISEEDYKHIEEMHPLGIGTTLDVAYSIAFLLADTSKWITGTTLVVDGGYTAH